VQEKQDGANGSRDKYDLRNRAKTDDVLEKYYTYLLPLVS
jgi:hypothetical protein